MEKGVITKPKRLEVDTDTLTAAYGKFTAEPLERGFGTTIGNSLRRVLLSSIQGAAVTTLRIEGVSHEFATLPGMKEDIGFSTEPQCRRPDGPDHHRATRPGVAPPGRSPR